MSERLKFSTILKRTLGALLALIVLLTLAGLFLPRESTVSNTNLQLLANQVDLFALFNSHDGHRDIWTNAAAKSGIEPMSFADMDGPESGVGTRFCFCPSEPENSSLLQRFFTSPSGIGEITESTEPDRVVIEIDWGIMQSRRTIELREIDRTRVEVNWQEDFVLSNPLLRYIPLLINEIDFSPALESAGEIVN